MGDINPRLQSVFDLELSTVQPPLLYTPLLASNLHAGMAMTYYFLIATMPD